MISLRTLSSPRTQLSGFLSLRHSPSRGTRTPDIVPAERACKFILANHAATVLSTASKVIRCLPRRLRTLECGLSRKKSATILSF